MLGGDPASGPAVDLFDLPLGDGHAWTLTEEKRNDREVRIACRRWPRCSRRGRPGPTRPGRSAGRPRGRATFLGLHARGARSLRRPPVRVRRLHEVGVPGRGHRRFRCPAGRVPRCRRQVRHRRADVRFNRPYAVVAVALDHTTEPELAHRTLPLGLPTGPGSRVQRWVGEVHDPVDDPDQTPDQPASRAERTEPMNAAAPAGPSPSSRRRTRAEPTTTPSASGADLDRLLGRRHARRRRAPACR